ncbi:S-layer homology domain-containing protein [Paenibacillus sp. GCM10027628]|uniref:S-layer homology domain-containing protein n=1 Tax=Paenibacillus sp. GCM10027628 TaxID=3273413 RepID=UPI0036380A92
MKYEVGQSDTNLNGVSPIYNFEIAAGGKSITAFNHPIEVTFKYDENQVGNPKNLAVYVLDEPSGTWKIVGGTLNDNGTITASLPHFSKYAVLEKKERGSEGTSTFTDIEAHWAQKEIEKLASQHIIDGMENNSFYPDANLTRAQFASILTKALQLKSSGKSTSFKDVTENSWYVEAVNAVYEANLVSGISEHEFAPEANITREQMAVMMVEAYLFVKQKDLSEVAPSQAAPYSDAETISNWARAYVQTATDLGLLNGYEGNRFDPTLYSSRAQAAVAIVRLLTQITSK